METLYNDEGDLRDKKRNGQRAQIVLKTYISEFVDDPQEVDNITHYVYNRTWPEISESELINFNALGLHLLERSFDNNEDILPQYSGFAGMLMRAFAMAHCQEVGFVEFVREIEHERLDLIPLVLMPHILAVRALLYFDSLPDYIDAYEPVLELHGNCAYVHTQTDGGIIDMLIGDRFHN